MGRPRIRNARPQDIDQVVDLNRKAGLSDWPRDNYEEAIRSDRFIFPVVELRDKGKSQIAGFALGIAIGEEMELLKLAVASSQQRKGLGSALLEETLRKARAMHCRRSLLEVSADNAPAICLYRKYRFSEICRRKAYYSHPLRDALVMQCYLEASGGMEERKDRLG